MADFGIIVSKEGVDARSATGTDVLLNATDPFAKLDTTKAISFSNIDFTFSNNPPVPSGISPNFYTTTLVYTKAHGYDYVPSFWALVTITTPVLGVAYDQDYFQDFGIVAATTAADGAEFFVDADDTNIYFYVHKYRNAGLGGGDNNLVGLKLRIRLYVFAEEIEA